MEKKTISLKRLVIQSIPEIWIYYLVTQIALVGITILIRSLAISLLSTQAVAFTSGNLSALLSWQGVVVIIIGLVVLFVYVAVELFGLVYLCDDIVQGRQAKVWRSFANAVKRGFLAIPRFFTPFGILILIYLILVVPLIGIGITIGPTSDFRIPNFIMDVISSSPVLEPAYNVLMIVLLIIGIFLIFSVYGVLIDGVKPFQAAKNSIRLIRSNGKRYLFSLLSIAGVVLLVSLLSYLLFAYIPQMAAQEAGKILPAGYVADFTDADMSWKVVSYRAMTAFAILEGTLLQSVTKLTVLIYPILKFGSLYHEFSRNEERRTEFVPRLRKRKYALPIVLLAVSAVLLFGYSAVVGIGFNSYVNDLTDTGIIAHRTGGDMASENSVEGIYKAIGEGCAGCETDIQRTKDGFYIINHDNDFERLTGVKKTPQEMTLAEVRKLQIKDTTGSGKILQVPTLEELLDASGSDIKLFIELKGATADRQMVDDVVRLIRENYRIEDVALISLEYDVIDYAETTYPEFETGLLMFAGYGDIENMNCDIIMVEEDMMKNYVLDAVHNAGKKLAVWTANHDEGLHEILKYNVDYVITDKILLAKKVQEGIKNQSDYAVIMDMVNY